MPEPSRANVLKALDTDLGERLLRFARNVTGRNWLQAVVDANGLMDDGDLTDAEVPFVIAWLLHLMVNPSNGLTLATEWRQQQRAVSADEELLLDAYDDAWVSAALRHVARDRPHV